ncbi:MAG TPA: type VI secretion system tip protein TssI/VgrG [Labilithrix sp.]|nr:type VI secretion system tip protein TssI/VgrG [Labilithrix sp.]
MGDVESKFQEEHAQLEIDGVPHEVLGLRGDEGVMRIFRYDLTCASRASSEAPRALLGKSAHITLSAYGRERHVHGIVTEAARSVSDDGNSVLTVVVRPQAFLLTLGRECRVFQNKTVLDIVKEVFASSAQPTRWEITDSYEKHVYCAQYREDDWTFVSRLLEEEGIYCWFDHDGGQSVLVFSDLSTSAPEIPGGAFLDFALESGAHANQEVAFELGEEVRARTTRFTAASFDPARPRLEVKAVAGSGPLEAYDAPGGGPESPQTIARQVRNRLAAAIANSAGVTGAATSVRLAPGMVVEIGGCSASRLDGRYFLVGVATEVVQRRRGPSGGMGGTRSCSTTFRAIQEAVRYRPPEQAKPAKQSGFQTGQVVGADGAEVHPDVSGRVRVKLRWDRDPRGDDQAGRWMRVAQRGTTESMLLPRIGWNVLTMNEEGTVDAPWVLSRIHDAEHPPAYPLPGHKTRVVWKTATTPGGGSFNEIYFEDKQGQEEMFINASRDMTLLTQHVKKDEVTHDQSRVVGNNHAMTVGLNHNENVGHDQTVSIGGNETIVVGKGSEKSVGGNETATIGGNRNVKAGAQHNTNVLLDRRVSVGAAIIDVTLGQISSSSRFCTVLVGGARIAASGGTISEDVSKVKVQTIGGAKIESAGTNRPVDIKKNSVETVGGAMILRAGENFADTADKKSFWTIGATLTAKAPKVFLEAKDRIQIKCGASVLVLDKDSLEIISPAYDLSGAFLEVATAVVNHN